ncbi:MAG: hypothetical protein ACRDXC_09295 [Acidimicrobiales bacterium]
MCGIVGLHLRSRDDENSLGEWMVPMLEALSVRGPDSTGIAVFRDDLPIGHLKFSLRAPSPDFGWEPVARALGDRFHCALEVRPQAADALVVTDTPESEFLRALTAVAPGVRIVGWGHAIEVIKDVGDAATVCDRYDIAKAEGYQAVGHTRMATESAVTTEHSHPFAPAPDLAFAHNGSFSNHATIRRQLAEQGVTCETDNDSEVAARFVAAQMAEGKDLGDAMRMVLKVFDGFFTLLVATANQFAVVRDSFACKPLVVAETPDYVAVASEYVALAALPGVGAARVFEPMPEELHVWSR